MSFLSLVMLCKIHKNRWGSDWCDSDRRRDEDERNDLLTICFLP